MLFFLFLNADKIYAPETPKFVPISNIFGSPNSKTANISSFLRIKNKNDYIFFGDSYSDASAAANCLIDFAYRSYPLNFYKKPDYFTYTFSDFRNEIN